MELNQSILKALDIRYVKLHFSLQIAESSELPVYKASAIRGGMGEMLLRANCISNRNCENCGFEEECVVQRIMYSKYENPLAFGNSKDSIGYVVECEDYRTEYAEGDILGFNLILFGKDIVYFSQCLNAIYALGVNGLGAKKAKFRIISIRNTHGEEMLDGNNVNMDAYKVCKLIDYVRYRFSQIKNSSDSVMISLKMPLSMKYKNEIVQEISAEVIINAIKRRLYMLDSFENVDGSELWNLNIEMPHGGKKESYNAEIMRYSSRQNSTMKLKGIKGFIELNHISEDVKALLCAGELVHIGKNTSFGFGKYVIK